MATISLTVGKFRSNIFTVTNADGSVNTALSLAVSTGDATGLRVRLNPNNNREVGVMGLTVGTAATCTVVVSLPGGPKQSQDLFQVQADPNNPNQEALTGAGWSDETDPPSWMM